jgi:hypothetical protein
MAKALNTGLKYLVFLQGVGMKWLLRAAGS